MGQAKRDGATLWPTRLLRRSKGPLYRPQSRSGAPLGDDVPGDGGGVAERLVRTPLRPYVRPTATVVD